MSPQVLLGAMVAFYLLVVAGTGALMAWTDREETRQQAEAATATIVRLLEEHAIRTLDGAELALLRTADRAATQPATRQALIEGRRALAEMVQAMPHLANLYLLDPEGRVVLDAQGFTPAGYAFSDRDWVISLRKEDGPATVFAPIVFDDGSRGHAFTVARRMTDHAGRLVGFAAAMVDLDYFRGFYQHLDIGPNPAFGIYRLDGAPLVRFPLRKEDIQRGMPAAQLFTEHVSQSRQGTFRSASPQDGSRRVISYRAMDDRPLVVWVSVGEDEAIAGWRRRALRTALLLAASFVVMAGLTWLLSGEFRTQRRAASELKAANLELERSNADLEQFAYIASHDLKEPLRNIASYVQLLQRRYQGRLDPDADAFIGYTVDGVRRMQSIINELLAYSRIGTSALGLQPVQSGAAVSAALGQLKSVIAEAQAVVDVQGPLPMVTADPGQLTSLFQNLIGNSLKYRRDDVRPEVAVGCVQQDKLWAFYIRDNGIGIDRGYHDQIFDLFKRLHPRDRYTGTGIGLAVCKRVVERHGGRIWVESEPGRGSTFWFTLPG